MGRSQEIRKAAESFITQEVIELYLCQRRQQNMSSVAGEMSQLVESPLCQSWQPDFSPWDPHGGNREPIPASCPLASTCKLGVCGPLPHPSQQIQMYKKKNKRMWNVYLLFNIPFKGNRQVFDVSAIRHCKDKFTWRYLCLKHVVLTCWVQAPSPYRYPPSKNKILEHGYVEITFQLSSSWLCSVWPLYLSVVENTWT